MFLIVTLRRRDPTACLPNIVPDNRVRRVDYVYEKRVFEHSAFIRLLCPVESWVTRTLLKTTLSVTGEVADSTPPVLPTAFRLVCALPVFRESDAL